MKIEELLRNYAKKIIYRDERMLGKEFFRLLTDKIGVPLEGPMSNLDNILKNKESEEYKHENR